MVTDFAETAVCPDWTIVAVHDSKESWERFRDDILRPALGRSIKGGFSSPPQETAFEVYNLQK